MHDTDMYIYFPLGHDIIDANFKMGGLIMTTKELLYIEDALGHAKYLRCKCKEVAGQLEDAELKAFVEQMEQKHQQIFQKFYGLL